MSDVVLYAQAGQHGHRGRSEGVYNSLNNYNGFFMDQLFKWSVPYCQNPELQLRNHVLFIGASQGIMLGL
jgi:hypothetical protein